uniref:E3 ubiquitin-protein ligase RMA n=1 Tax=Opuntia streptacantha TaxID=393608 RepID=A0A7C9E1P9_OPUST
MAQYIQHPMRQNESCGEEFSKLKSTSAGTSGLESNSSGGFDCNICLDLVQDPVVTFCGHLYCWPCIYRWICCQRAAPEEHPGQQPQCPVCKADVSLNTLIPLYGRGQSGKPSDGKDAEVGPVVPQRPKGPTCGVHTLITTTASTGSLPGQQHHRIRGYPNQQVHPYYSLSDYPTTPAFGFAGTTTFHPMIGMFGEMIYARIFGNSHAGLYDYPHTYSVATTSSARARRHVVQVDRSLSRVSFFLCCCVVLCLLLF